MTATASAAAENVRELPPRPDVVAAAEAESAAAEEAARPGILRLEPLSEDEKELREVAFYVGDKPYTALKNPPAGMAIEYLDQMRRNGPLISEAWLLRSMLGDDGYTALTTYRKLTAGQLQTVLKTCRDKVMGALETPKEQP